MAEPTDDRRSSVSQAELESLRCVIGGRLLVAMSRRGWTSQDLATRSGVARQTVNRACSGDGSTIDTLALLASALELPLPELVAPR